MSILRKFNRVSTLAIVAAALCITQAQAEEFVNKPFPFKRMVTFGDSLSDIGALKPPLDLIRQNQQKITQTLRDISGSIDVFLLRTLQISTGGNYLSILMLFLHFPSLHTLFPGKL